ncbi:MAG: TetR/AcrR family transcriptional regulator [Pseudomonadota bacterium]
MARYSPEHKAASRKTLIGAAAELFRKHGYTGVGIDDLCAAAGLTRGAFYGHFTSKANLFTAVLRGAHDFVERLRVRPGFATRHLKKQGVQVAKDYLDPRNRAAVVAGCSLSALAADTVRADADAQAAYAQAVADVVSELTRGASGERAMTAEQARTMLALCVGGLLINNACGNNPEGERVALAARRALSRVV